MKIHTFTSPFIKAAVPFIALALTACGGGSGTPALSAETSPTTTTSTQTPNPTIAGRSMRECFTVKSPGTVFEKGRKERDNQGNYSGIFSEYERVTVATNNERFPGGIFVTTLLKSFFREFNTDTEYQTQLSADGLTLKTISEVDYAYSSVLEMITSRNFLTGAMPLDLAIGETRVYEETYEESKTKLGRPSLNTKETSSTKITLLAIEPLPTIGKQFPFACKVEFIEAKYPDVRTVRWYAPNFQVVKSVKYTPSGVTGDDIEVVKVTSEPIN